MERFSSAKPSMGQRLYRWGQRSLQRAKEKWWFWFFVALFEDRVMGTLNSALDSFSSEYAWVSTLKWAVAAFDSIGLGFLGNVFLLTILVLVIIAFIETRPRKYVARGTINFLVGENCTEVEDGVNIANVSVVDPDRAEVQIEWETELPLPYHPSIQVMRATFTGTQAEIVWHSTKFIRLRFRDAIGAPTLPQQISIAIG